MTNGFYNTSNFSKLDIRSFVRKAIRLSYTIRCESIIGIQRQIVKTLYVDQYIKAALNSNDYRLYVVDRFAHSNGAFKKENCDYEICLTFDSNFLYIFVNEDNFNKLIKQFNLTLTGW